ncbi:hypothetical protein SAMN05421770_10324 [Granulicella rosea]|uniref:Uncharacterized protein n=1 Tax=Granulicella rosea TaxID=474952 RepID=A0A239IAS7_9BACT|nr:hypothetical protein [Granulicella rosea]SNS90651.1 hypothetical protein SAMN05421770_10324 [Granulicella rosea]
MANGLVRVGGGAIKQAAKKAIAKKAAKHAVAKHAAKKHAAKKHPAKKHAEKAAKHPGKKAAKHAHEHGGADFERKHAPAEDHELALAFHHLNRAATVVSLLEHDSGGDLRMLLEQGMVLYRGCCNSPNAEADKVRCALGLLRAADHLGMAALYAARQEHRPNVEHPSTAKLERSLRELKPRLEALGAGRRGIGERLLGMAWQLLEQAHAAEDPHLSNELLQAAGGLCLALEAGL